MIAIDTDARLFDVRAFTRAIGWLVAAFLIGACDARDETSEGSAVAREASGPSGTPVAASVMPYTAVDLAVCLRIAAGELQPDERQCLGFISTSAAEAISTCMAFGGSLVASEQPSLQSLDVNGDGEPEFLYDFTANFGCDTAASVFSCGSLGCPVALIASRDGAWITIGSLASQHAEGAEVLAPEGQLAYGALRGGCGGRRPCDELWHYRWDGSTYEPDTIEVRGHVVDFANDGFWTLVDDQSVLAEPSADAAVLDRYPNDTTVVVIGDARTPPFRYVSPCNACTSGFVDAGVLRRAQ